MNYGDKFSQQLFHPNNALIFLDPTGNLIDDSDF